MKRLFSILILVYSMSVLLAACGGCRGGGVPLSSTGTVKVTHLAGPLGGFGNAEGTGAAANFTSPSGITTDGTNLYVVDTSDGMIRKIVIATGAVTTLAGTAGNSGSADGTGAVARFNLPYGITTDGTNLYVSDTYNHTIRKIVIATGAVTTLAGTAGGYGSADSTGAAVRFNLPYVITTDGTNLFVPDSRNDAIRMISMKYVMHWFENW